MLFWETTNINFAIELSLKKISYVVYLHAPMCTRYDVKIVCSKDAQWKTEESPLLNIHFIFVTGTVSAKILFWTFALPWGTKSN